MRRLLRIEVALVALLLAPLFGYAIAYFLAGETGPAARAMQSAPAVERGA